MTILSVNPTERCLLVAHESTDLSLYSLDLARDAPLTLSKIISMDVPCRSISWETATSSVVLDAKNRASLVKADGTVQEWKTTDDLIALDVMDSVAVWVKAATPAVLTIHGFRDVDFEEEACEQC